MRAHWTVIAVTLTVLATAAPARAAECSIDPGSTDYQAALLPALSGLQSTAHTVLGAQFAGVWFKTARQGVDVGVAPGPLDLDAAQSAVSAALSPTDAAMLTGHVLFDSQPYGIDELTAVQNTLTGILPSIQGAVGLGCSSGAWRVVLDVPPTATPEQVALALNTVAPYGDRVTIMRIGPFVATDGVGTVPASKARVRSYVTLPRVSRCVRGKTIHLLLRSGPRGVTVQVGAAIKNYKAPRRVAVRLTGRITEVSVELNLPDGPADQTFSFTRCGG